VDQTVQDAIGNCGIPDVLVPARDRQLGSEAGGASLVAIPDAPHGWEVSATGRLIHAFDLPILNVDGSPLILEVDVGVTEQRQAQERLREASRYTRSLIEASLDPLVTISREGKITDSQ